MRNLFGIVALLLSGVMVSCFDDDTFRPTEFFIQNNCPFIIEVKSSALIRSQLNGTQKVSKDDFIQNGQTFMIRRVDVSEAFAINDVFVSLEIYKSVVKSNEDVFLKSKWVKGSSTSGIDNFTLIVDETFF